MELILILLIPLVLALIPFAEKEPEKIGRITAGGCLAGFLLSLHLAYRFSLDKAPVALFNFFYADALSIFFILTIFTVTFAAALFSTQYIAHNVKSGNMTERKGRFYYVLFDLFAFSMLFVVSVNNLGIMWASIEMTTLISAFLVGFHNAKKSVEAAWKYLIICSVGIILALLGTILFSWAFILAHGARSLNWTDMYAGAGGLNVELVKTAFIFILIGYGTKAGLVPMHTWLPDAHSQALSPVSALLSGVLLETAVYAIFRYTVILNRAAGPEFSGNLLVIFGILSLAVSAGFILAQKDIKRLLAYSSVEHIGIITLGLGIGGKLGIFGALLHVFNHAVTKSLLFFGAGNIIRKYDTNMMRSIRGVLLSMPFTGFMVLAGTLALAGMPPFSIFFSELIILISAFSKGSYLAAGLFLFFVALIFGAIVHHFSKMLFGAKPEGLAEETEPVETKICFLFLFLFICAVGFTVPQPLGTLIDTVSDMFSK